MSLLATFVSIQWALLHIEGFVIIGVDEVYKEGDFDA